MARRRFAPTHTLTGTPRYVPVSDSAWREDQIPNADAPGALDHPYWQYVLGNTRFNLDDPGVLECIDLEKKPETWTLRPLTIKQRQRVSFLSRQNLLEDAATYAFLHGVVTVDNLEGADGKKIAEMLAAKKRDHDGLVEAIGDYAAEILGVVGDAVITLSRDMKPQEKKASDSPPGSGSPSPET
jgi:hypothetical protein